jgi:hypothetical protein
MHCPAGNDEHRSVDCYPADPRRSEVRRLPCASSPRLPGTRGSDGGVQPPDLGLLRIAHFDPRPRGPGGPGRAASDRFRLAHRLEVWIEVQDGRVVDAGQAGDGRINVTKVGYGPASVAFTPGRPTRPAARTGDRAHLGAVCPNGRWSDRLPHPRRVRHEPYVQVGGGVTWTTLALTLHADGTAEPRLLGASSFPATGSTTTASRWHSSTARSGPGFQGPRGPDAHVHPTSGKHSWPEPARASSTWSPISERHPRT